MGSALYEGRIRHRRRGEVENAFSYRFWQVLLDLDEVDEISRRIPFFSHNRFNLVGFADRDHMGPEASPVRRKLASWFAARGLALPDGRVQLLAGLRHLGWAFDPVSFYYCFDRAEVLRWVVAEVNNTFGETFCYLLEAGGESSAAVVRQERAKVFHVSPFQPIDGHYRFRITPPAERLTVHIDIVREGDHTFDATLTGQRRPLTARTLLSTLLRHPHQTLATLALIHYQAARLWRKRAPFFAKPLPPADAWRTRHG
jgi:DUF1365 family protein